MAVLKTIRRMKVTDKIRSLAQDRQDWDELCLRQS